MVELREHIQFLKQLKLNVSKKWLLKYLHHVFTQHALEIRDLDAFIDEIMKKD